MFSENLTIDVCHSIHAKYLRPHRKFGTQWTRRTEFCWTIIPYIKQWNMWKNLTEEEWQIFFYERSAPHKTVSVKKYVGGGGFFFAKTILSKVRNTCMRRMDHFFKLYHTVIIIQICEFSQKKYSLCNENRREFTA